MFAAAAILEGCAFINGSPQNTFVPGVLELASQKKVFIAGDDFKSGQTKMKSVLVDFFVSAGIKPESIVSYNHLGNNDGKNLSAPKQFRSKEISKSNVVDDMVCSNPVLFPKKLQDAPDHCVVIKYVPFVGDSKRAMDEYSSQIFMNGINTISSYNICEDSLLATPLMYDMIVLGELFSRMEIDGQKLGPVLAYLSFFFKAPITNHDEYVINSFSRQRETLVNLLKVTAGILPDDTTLLSFKF